jgi:small-conductance mechanosensitive channel
VAFEPGFGEAGMAFTANFHVNEFASQSPVRNELRKRVLRRFRADGIAIPYPARTLYLRQGGWREARTRGAGEAPGPKEI